MIVRKDFKRGWRYRVPGKWIANFLCLILTVWLGISLTRSGWADTSPRTLPVDLTSEEKAWLATHKEVRLGVDPLWPPFEMLENDGRYSGIASDCVRLLSERLGMRMTPVRDLEWVEAIEGAKAGRIDVLPCLAKTSERSEFLNFTKPYLSFPVVIATRQDFPFVSGAQDFKPGKVAVIEGKATQVWLNRDYPNMDFFLVGDSEEALKALSEGKVDAFVDNIAAITYATQRLGLLNLRIATSTPYRFELAFGIRKDWPELASIMDKTLAAMSETEKTTINNRWIMVRVEREVNWQLLLKIFLPILACGILVLVFFVRWNRKLAREVSERKASEERLQGNKGLYRKLLLSFVAGYAQTADDLRKVLDENDYDQAHSVVHSIKGVAGNLAARELHAATVMLEKLLKNVDEKNPPLPERINEAFTSFEEQLERALQAVRSLPPAEDEQSSAPSVEPVGSLPPEQAEEAAGRLREAAEMGDMSSLMAITEELSSRSDGFAPYKMKIAQLVDDFDFDGILKLADDLLKEQGN